MGRLSEKIKSAAPKRRKLAGLERRWLINNVSVMVVLAALCVAGNYAESRRILLFQRALGAGSEGKDHHRLFQQLHQPELQRILPVLHPVCPDLRGKGPIGAAVHHAGRQNGRLVLRRVCGQSPQTPDIQEAVTTGKLARFQGKDPDTHERILAVSSPMVYSNGEVIGVLRYVTGLKTWTGRFS